MLTHADSGAAAHTAFSAIRAKFNQLQRTLEDDLVPVVARAGAFLSGEMSKLDLALAFQDLGFSTALDGLAALNYELQLVVNDYVSALASLASPLIDSYLAWTEFRFPSLTVENVRSLELVKALALINDTVLEGMLASLETDLETSLTGLITESYSRLRAPVDAMKDAIIKPVTALHRDLLALQQDLHEYSQSTVTDTDFFM